MTETTERAVLAGGCFWGVEELVRNLPGVITTRVGYTGGDVPNATYRKHGTHAEGIEITFDPAVTSYRDLLEFFFQIHDPTTRTVRATTSGRATGRRSTTPPTSSGRSPRRRSPTSRRQACGPARWSPRWSRPGRSGRPSRSTRTTCSATRTATRAISSGRTGSCPAARSRHSGPAPPLESPEVGHVGRPCDHRRTCRRRPVSARRNVGGRSNSFGHRVRRPVRGVHARARPLHLVLRHGRDRSAPFRGDTGGRRYRCLIR